MFEVGIDGGHTAAWHQHTVGRGYTPLSSDCRQEMTNILNGPGFGSSDISEWTFNPTEVDASITYQTVNGIPYPTTSPLSIFMSSSTLELPGMNFMCDESPASAPVGAADVDFPVSTAVATGYPTHVIGAQKTPDQPTGAIGAGVNDEFVWVADGFSEIGYAALQTACTINGNPPDGSNGSEPCSAYYPGT
ncbi:MAG TPA: hypothetical protein VHU90_09930 [Galbitalea sp.]|nr:hypothetical protein [Galbitalea sp.]